MTSTAKSLRREVGALLRRLREARGLSQEAAAAHLGLKGHTTILRQENGGAAITYDQLHRLLELYGRPDLIPLGKPHAEPKDHAVKILAELLSRLPAEDRREILDDVARIFLEPRVKAEEEKNKLWLLRTITRQRRAARGRP